MYYIEKFIPVRHKNFISKFVALLFFSLFHIILFFKKKLTALENVKTAGWDLWPGCGIKYISQHLAYIFL